MHVVIWNINTDSGFVFNDEHSSSTLGRWKGISYLYPIAVHHDRVACGSPSHCQSPIVVLGSFSLFVLYFHISLDFGFKLVYCSSCCLHEVLSAQTITWFHARSSWNILSLKGLSRIIKFSSWPCTRQPQGSLSLISQGELSFFFLCFFILRHFWGCSDNLTWEYWTWPTKTPKNIYIYKNKRCAARAAVNSHFCSSHRSMAVHYARDLVCKFLFPSLQGA